MIIRSLLVTEDHLVCEERRKRHRHEMKEEEEGEELKRRVERDFQTELKKMMEAEKVSLYLLNLDYLS